MKGPTSGSYRLTKPRTNDTTPLKPSDIPPKSPKFKTSFEDLRNAEARQALKDHLNGTFPETTRRPSLDSVGVVDMPSLGHRFSKRSSKVEVVNNASANSSSSTVDSVGPKRLSAVPERENKTVDLEQAIQLLQELKKIASPDELVALHRALLPTKEVPETVTSPKMSSFEERAAFSASPVYQRRSNIPPGLATRGGPDEDLLRKPWEAPREPQKANNVRRPARLQHSTTSTTLHHSTSHTTSASISSLAALDLADDTANPLGPRATTPDWSYSNIGGFRSGTLRITNGAASPEPSLRTAVSHQTMLTETNPDTGYFTASEGRRSEDANIGRASIDVLPRRVSEESVRVRDRIMMSGKAQQQRKQRAQRISAISTPSKESLVSQMSQNPLRVTTKVSRQSFDGESVSPVSDAPTPRWGPSRQSHRASEISAEYASDCEISASPYEETKNPLQSFASRLSTVYDSDADDADEVEGTPAAALSKLTGDSDEAARQAELALAPVRVNHSQEPTQEDSDDMIIIQRPPPKKTDSGYGSDSSHRMMPRKTSSEQRWRPSIEGGPWRKPFLSSDANLQEVDEKDETASLTDAKSLYTFEEVLSSPDLLSNLADPMPHNAKGKKSLPLLRLHTLNTERRGNSPLAVISPEASSDTLPTIASAESSPADPKKAAQNAKQQKRLQKPMPAAVKKQRKEEYRKMKEQHSAVELPAVSDNVLAAHSKRMSDQPSSAYLDHTYASINNTDSQETLERIQPVEMIGDVEFPDAAHSEPEPTPRRSFARNRSKSRGRGRASNDRQASRESSPEVQRGWSISRLRSKSGSRPRSQTPKRSSVDTVRRKSVDKAREDRAASPDEENMPAYTDFSSVARTLGSGSYDISTNQFKRATAPAPGAFRDDLQSPYAISTGLTKPKSMKGMNSQAAAELARMKSRDITQPDSVPQKDRPRIAFPMSLKGKGRSASGGSAPTTPVRKVEDRFPDWQSKPAALRDTSPQRPHASHRPHSMYAESIPPMPELPADAVVRAIKADEMVAKKLKDSARSTPAASARNSAEDTQHQRKPESAKKNTKQQQAKPVEDKAFDPLLHPTERVGAKQAAIVNVQVHELSGSGSEQSSTNGGEDAPLQSPSHDAQHPGWPGWEQQAKAWRQRRESLGAALGKPADEASVITADSPPVSRKPSYATPPSHGLASSPSIVVSRYITPLAAENAARNNARFRRPSESAVYQTSTYRDLVGDEKENRPAKQDVPRTDSAVTTSSTSTFVTVKSWDPRPAKQDVPRTNTAGSAFSTQTYHSVNTSSDPRPAKQDVPRIDTAGSALSTDTYHSVTTTSTIGLARSPVRHTRTSSGKFIPYSPSQASMAERSRALSLAKLSGEAGSSSTSLDTQTGHMSHANNSAESLVNRYSGGLNYGWDRRTGFAGSAGTRDSGNGSGNELRRKSKHMSSEFGLDLSDVPVFLQRAR